MGGEGGDKPSVAAVIVPPQQNAAAVRRVVRISVPARISGESNLFRSLTTFPLFYPFPPVALILMSNPPRSLAPQCGGLTSAPFSRTELTKGEAAHKCHIPMDEMDEIRACVCVCVGGGRFFDFRHMLRCNQCAEWHQKCIVPYRRGK